MNRKKRWILAVILILAVLACLCPGQSLGLDKLYRGQGIYRRCRKK